MRKLMTVILAVCLVVATPPLAAVAWLTAHARQARDAEEAARDRAAQAGEEADRAGQVAAEAARTAGRQP